MIFDVSCEIDYEVRFPSTLVLSVHAQRSSAQVVLEEKFSIEPGVTFSEFLAQGSGNRFVRVETGKRKTLHIRYAAAVECDYQLLAAKELQATPIAEMTADELQYLFPSRYCQSDRLGRLAWDLFGDIDGAHGKVVAITEWIHSNVEYLRGTSDWTTSAYETVIQRTGVCRDFAHLGIALCRALNIPARYFTGYAYQLEPPDMHACFECFIGGSWTIFDATRLAHLNGLVRVGIGRDAADAAVASIFGDVRCQRMAIDCQLAPGQQFTAVGLEQLGKRAVELPNSRGH